MYILTFSFDNIDAVQVFGISQVKQAVGAELRIEQRAIQHLELSDTSVGVRGEPRIYLCCVFKALSINGDYD